MTLNNEYFRNLFAETWSQIGSDASTQYKATIRGGTDSEEQDIYALGTDLQLRWEPSFAAIGQEYASNEDVFLRDFSAAWTKWMQIDRFDGPTGNVCGEFAGRDAMYRCEDNRCVVLDPSSNDIGVDRTSCEALCGAAASVSDESDAHNRKEASRDSGSQGLNLLSSILADML